MLLMFGLSSLFLGSSMSGSQASQWFCTIITVQFWKGRARKIGSTRLEMSAWWDAWNSHVSLTWSCRNPTKLSWLNLLVSSWQIVTELFGPRINLSIGMGILDGVHSFDCKSYSSLFSVGYPLIFCLDSASQTYTHTHTLTFTQLRSDIEIDVGPLEVLKVEGKAMLTWRFAWNQMWVHASSCGISHSQLPLNHHGIG